MDDLLRSMLGKETYDLLQKSKQAIDAMNKDPKLVEVCAQGIIERIESLTKEQIQRVAMEQMIQLTLLISSARSAVVNPILFNDLLMKLFLYGVTVGMKLDDDAWDTFKEAADKSD